MRRLYVYNINQEERTKPRITQTLAGTALSGAREQS
nr:MAG TPA: hypothetical protein [Caudoviricetes sp.]